MTATPRFVRISLRDKQRRLTRGFCSTLTDATQPPENGDPTSGDPVAAT